MFNWSNADEKSTDIWPDPDSKGIAFSPIPSSIRSGQSLLLPGLSISGPGPPKPPPSSGFGAALASIITGTSSKLIQFPLRSLFWNTNVSYPSIPLNSKDKIAPSKDTWPTVKNGSTISNLNDCEYASNPPNASKNGFKSTTEVKVPGSTKIGSKVWVTSQTISSESITPRMKYITAAQSSGAVSVALLTSNTIATPPGFPFNSRISVLFWGKKSFTVAMLLSLVNTFTILTPGWSKIGWVIWVVTVFSIVVVITSGNSIISVSTPQKPGSPGYGASPRPAVCSGTSIGPSESFGSISGPSAPNSPLDMITSKEIVPKQSLDSEDSLNIISTNMNSSVPGSPSSV